jgi:hypothetical protein
MRLAIDRHVSLAPRQGGRFDFTSGALPAGVTYTGNGGNGTRVNSSGVMVQSVADTARFTYDPISLLPLGVYVEPARTNSALRSAAFGTTWGTMNATVSSDTANGADGAATADQFLEVALNTEHYVQQTVSGPAVNAPATFTVFAKTIGGQFLNLQGFDSAATANFSTVTFDLSGAGAASAILNQGVAASATASIERAASSLYRCRLTSTINSGGAGTSILARIRSAASLGTGAGSVVFLGDVAKGLTLWGAQLEAGDGASSYIPTAGASVTRSADVLTFTALPAGAYRLTYGDNTTADISHAGGDYIVPTSAGRTLKRLVAL